ncbi:FliM/FliN family flagellar motor switch protein [Minwuia sp.]|uniref:FliM/FliN family flagellar motor switch protein n=1 Tax=Minwuia sp. TaxID=2493630 RepID=UPI003A94EDAC
MSTDENSTDAQSGPGGIEKAVGEVDVEISVVLGRAQMAIHQLLKMGRGAVIELDSGVDDLAWILANNQIIARGEIVVTGEHVGISVVETYTGLQS